MLALDSIAGQTKDSPSAYEEQPLTNVQSPQDLIAEYSASTKGSKVKPFEDVEGWTHLKLDNKN